MRHWESSRTTQSECRLHRHTFGRIRQVPKKQAVLLSSFVRSLTLAVLLVEMSSFGNRTCCSWSSRPNQVHLCTIGLFYNLSRVYFSRQTPLQIQKSFCAFYPFVRSCIGAKYPWHHSSLPQSGRCLYCKLFRGDHYKAEMVLLLSLFFSRPHQL